MITIDPAAQTDTQSGQPLLRPTLTRFLNRARAAIDLPGAVSVLLTSDAELRRLNRTFRGKDKPTDVLSFPANPIPGLPATHQHAGDLAISLHTAARQAAEHGHPLATELRILLLHGLLHIAGFDHETDTGEMASRESILRTRFRLPQTLIARSAQPTQPPRAQPSGRSAHKAPASAALSRAPRKPASSAVRSSARPRGRGTR